MTGHYLALYRPFRQTLNAADGFLYPGGAGHNCPPIGEL
nr:C613 [uncultured bacterium]